MRVTYVHGPIGGRRVRVAVRHFPRRIRVQIYQGIEPTIEAFIEAHTRMEAERWNGIAPNAKAV